MIGFQLFLVSEIMLFMSFIWAQLWAALAPDLSLGAQWPPVGIQALNPWSLPQVGTTLLQTSGLTVTWSHHALIRGQKALALLTLGYTIILGGSFVILQGLEYLLAPFEFSSGIWGTSFFMLTGLHGLHVIAGVSFLIICFLRIRRDQLTTEHHVAYLFAIYYWHMVDVVWILVFLLAYVWGGDMKAAQQDLQPVYLG